MIDPFDIVWAETDPKNREVVMLQSVINARAGKHTNPTESLSPEEVRELVRSPDRIDDSSKTYNTSIYYSEDNAATKPYARAVVRFDEDDGRGKVTSWSRYDHPVSSYGVIWRKEES